MLCIVNMRVVKCAFERLIQFMFDSIQFMFYNFLVIRNQGEVDQ